MKNQFFEFIKVLIRKYDNTYVSRVFYQYQYEAVSFFENSSKLISYLEANKENLTIHTTNDSIHFSLKIQSSHNGNMKTLGELSHKEFTIENISKERFWTNENLNLYQNISNFNVFLEIKTSRKDYWKTMINSPFYNVEGIVNYYKEAFEIIFTDFQHQLITRGKTIYYKPWVNETFIGIEVDYKTLIKYLKKGEFDGPSYVLYYFKLEKNKPNSLFNLGGLGLPLFPLFPFKSFIPLISCIEVSDRETRFDIGLRAEEIDENNVKIYNNGKFDETIKKHIFYYLSISKQTTIEYLNFLEKEFDIINDD